MGPRMGMSVAQYIDWAQGQTIPPLCVEVLMRSGKSFFVKHFFPVDAERQLVPVRVWDLRSLSGEGLSQLLADLNKVMDRRDLTEFQSQHPDVDQGNLWMRLEEVEAIMEWHDRFWPEPPIVEDRPLRIDGFNQSALNSRDDG